MKKENVFLRAFTMDWNNEEGDMLRLEYSYDQKEWYALNGSNGVFLPRQGSKRIKNPKMIKNDNGVYTFYADDVMNEFMIYTFITKDFMNFKSELMLPKASVPEREKATDIIEISFDVLKELQNKWGAPEPVVIESIPEVKVTVKKGETALMPERVYANLSNGAKDDMPVKWDTVDTSTTGEKIVKGTVTQHFYTNPLIYHRADPYIYKHTDGYYYFVASYTDMDNNLVGEFQYIRILLRRAKTLAELADEGGNYTEVTVFERKPLPGNQSPHIWAPEVHFINGSWYIYYTTVIDDMQMWSIRPHVLECKDADPMTGTWNDLGRVQKTVEEPVAFTDFSLDHTVLQHNGELYFFWAEKHPEYSKIFAAKMINPWTIDSSRISVVVEPEYNWEIHGFPVCEGPGFLHRNGKIFMTYSASGTDSLYAMGMIYADDSADLLDPFSWTKIEYPVFQSSTATDQYGPGHNSFTTDEDGKDVLVYHARQEQKYLCDPTYQPLYDAGRNTSIMRFYWNVDGTPNFSIPVADGKDRIVTREVVAKVTVI